MKLHLIDGTYELFRTFFGAPPSAAPDGMEVGATKALLRSLWNMIDKEKATHLAVAFDHVIESFRNELFDGYKTGDGITPELKEQFHLAEDAVRALGIVVWPMVEFEADDALATMAHRGFEDSSVEQVLICTPDKDLMQCVRGDRVVSWDRRRKLIYDETMVVEKFGVPPKLIPDFLGLVGDSADGIPGVPRWGQKSTAQILSALGALENIPEEVEQWGTKVRGQKGLCENLNKMREEAALYKKLAVLRFDVPLEEKPADLEYRGAHRGQLRTICERLGDMRFFEKVDRWQD